MYERLNLERPNLRVIKIRNKNLYHRENLRIGKIASSAKYRMDEIYNFGLQIYKLVNFSIRTI